MTRSSSDAKHALLVAKKKKLNGKISFQEYEDEVIKHIYQINEFHNS